MRLLQHTEINDVTGAGLNTLLMPTVAKVQQDVVQRVLGVAVDPYGSTVGLTLLGIRQSVKVPAGTLDLLKATALL